MDQVFTTTSLFSLLGVSALAAAAYVGAHTLLPKNANSRDRYTFMWLVSCFGLSYLYPDITLVCRHLTP